MNALPWPASIGLILVLALMTPLIDGRSAQAGVATFENFVEGQGLGTSFTDPLSGIEFVNPIPAASSFIVDFGSETAIPYLPTGNYLTADSFTAGPGFSFAANFGFTGILPELSDRIVMDAYLGNVVGPASIDLLAFDAGGAQVGEDHVSVEAPGYVKFITVTTVTAEINSFRISATGASVGYDNVTFGPAAAAVPLPRGVYLGGLGLIMAAFFVRRGRGRIAFRH